MKKISICLLVLLTFSFTSKKNVSTKKFPPISLINKIEFFESKYDWDKIGGGFLLKYKADTFVLTAQHILKYAKTDSMKYLSIEGFVKKWSLSQLNKENESVVLDVLLNENKAQLIKSDYRFIDDWLLFSIKENNSKVKPVEIRETQLVKGEKLYVVGWTRDMTEGEQHTFEFNYLKSKGSHFLMKHIIVPDKFGGLSGSPVLDENGFLVGIASSSTFEFTAMKRLFSPCNLDSLKIFLDNYSMNK